ncbi:DUF6571 family protein [Streptomyces boncukensis]|uniref:AG2 protein n=1 Tax=Streptomyces boncukensis TaxID=2711219 RepID=A0A6G4X0F7_9ACTN|nr:DUF6571 family protein [Streptomyces boncukensis]NGO71026.1 hypothetical protein [Streptomyces boncukensis]
MELTYHDVMKADFASLSETAKAWRTMGKSCKKVHDNYRDQVRKRLTGWTGEAANAFWMSSRVTLHEMNAARSQAYKVAKLLDDARGRLDAARKHVESVRDAAVKDGMKVDPYGKCTTDTGGMSDKEAGNILRDPGRADREREWTHRIVKAVKKVADADRENMLALKAAATDTDGKGADNGFNSKAIGDVDKYVVKRSADLATKLDSGKDGGGLSAGERKELQLFLRSNSDDKEFTRTFLNSIGGPEGTIKLTNALNDLAHKGDTDHRGQYLGIDRSLSTTLATATRVPEFKGANGKRLALGSPEYASRYRDWLKTDDGAWYHRWREGMRTAGVKQYGMRAVQDATLGRGKPRGYQSLVTLMERGKGFSPQLLHDVADDIRTAEKENPGIWKLSGDFTGEHESWFVNDPYDGVLGMMAREPRVAAAYLDPNSDADPTTSAVEKNDRLDYLAHRDWKMGSDFVGGQGAADGPRPFAQVTDPDAHEGFEAALKAATTGRTPEDGLGTPIPHSAANARVMAETVKVFGGDPDLIRKDGEFAGTRPLLGEITAEYSGDVQRAQFPAHKFPVHGEGAEFDNGHLLNFLGTVGRDPEAYGTISSAQQAYTAGHLQQQMNELSEASDKSDAHDVASNAVFAGARVEGILSEAKAGAIYEDEIAEVQDFNKRAIKAGENGNKLFDVAIAVMGEAPGGSTAGVPVGWLQEDLSDSFENRVKKDLPQLAQRAQDEAKYDFENSHAAAMKNAARLTGDASRHAGLDDEKLIRAVSESASKSAGLSFADGSGSERQHGNSHPQG